jgi:hypothetical protein
MQENPEIQLALQTLALQKIQGPILISNLKKVTQPI